MTALTLLLLGACDSPVARPVAPPVTVSVQRVRSGTTDSATMLSMGVLVTDDEGGAIPCGDERLVLTVSWSADSAGWPWTELPAEAFTHVCSDEPRGDVALVVDNSGSEAGYLDPLRDGARVMTDNVLGAGGRASLTRVSTNASIRLALTDDSEAVEQALDELFIDNGWTALWDGIRMGNETLGPQTETAADLESFCGQTGRLGVVAFTDGQENNSADEQEYDHGAYPGDGIETRLDDLYALRSGGATTPI